METSINMRVFKTILLLLSLIAICAEATPLLPFPRVRETKPDNASETREKQNIDHFDQRQNGTENYRVKVDGLVFILAPADTLLLASAGLDPSAFASESNKPKPKPEEESLLKPKHDKKDTGKSAQNELLQQAGQNKPALRITNLIAPFLNRIRQSHQSKK